MSLDKNTIFEQLTQLAKRSYAPYSNFRVSCIIYLKNNQQIIGVNVENAAYNPCICAERCALSQLYAQGYDKTDVDLVALYTDSKTFGSPCGTCRQTMSELLKNDQKIYIFNQQGFFDQFSVKDLLPYAFSDKNLKR
ncbi:cytidine deaminase [Mycoplasma putrefaciens]|uniref:Cytidine deaminase n=2 Tax=Mycoplasma putrefaciens TaxID=2123 RepID=M9WDZ5_9MOLU|nr:cytidine deaminase [Mycoplasma putrefaciens]AEM68557.1 cytidine deaminase [Mycoplasma putrefaciens KS1]AGJ90981.1 Cytidine deaminase [Mycoplasma putrefaciens Mput9231]SYV95279.1 cytidine deaminase [Mycoplasma putrefaciens]